MFNSVTSDFVSDANAARPVSAGGTGSTNAADAREALGIDHLVGAAAEVSAALALDNIATPGWVYVASANCTTVGGPTGGGDGFVETGYTAAKRYQVYHPVSSTLSPWRRVYTADAWTSWRQDVTTGTGANGTYERFRSGLMICQINKITLEGTGSSLAATWTLPAAFVNAQYAVTGSLRGENDADATTTIAANADPLSANLGPILSGAKTTTSCAVRVFRNGSTDFGNGDELYADLTAIGRWF